jgi:hypothetical protein
MLLPGGMGASFFSCFLYFESTEAAPLVTDSVVVACLQKIYSVFAYAIDEAMFLSKAS